MRLTGFLPVVMVRGLATLALLFFSLSALADSIYGWYSTEVAAATARMDFRTANGWDNYGYTGPILLDHMGYPSVTALGLYEHATAQQIWFPYPPNGCPSGEIYVSPGVCQTPPSSCVVNSLVFMVSSTPGALVPSMCSDGCTISRSGITIETSNGEFSNHYRRTGATCSTSTPEVTSRTPPTETVDSPCTKSTLANGQISYDCGKEAATGISCRSTAAGYECFGGKSTATCWTSADGTINCTPTSTDGVDATVPIKTTTGTQKNPDGTTTKTKTELLPGGGWKTTETNYDASGAKTGETVTSGDGLKNDAGNGEGGGDGTSNPPAEPPTGTLPQSSVTLPGFTSSSFVGGTGGCPTSPTITAFGRTYQISFQPICDFAMLLKSVLIAISLFLAIRIFQNYVNEATA